ncbi:MAG: LEA type 2 family protein [Thermoanaerobaculia bacterium]
MARRFRGFGVALVSGATLAFAGGVRAAAPPRPASVAPRAAVAGLRVGPIGAEGFGVALVLAKGAAGACAGPFRGTLEFYGAGPGARFDGALKKGPGGCEMAARLPWNALPAGAVSRARTDAVTVRFVGEVADVGRARAADWSATIPRAAVALTESMRVTLRRFVRSPEIHLGGLGVKTTAMNAEVEVLSPLAFDLRVVEARYEVEANGRKVASGVKEKFIVHGGRANRIEVPVTVQNGAAIAAAGKTLVKGGKVDGKLTGRARLRFPGGDVDFPLELPVKLSLR